MINFENCEIGNIIIHNVGNKYEGGELVLSETCFLPEDADVLSLLKNYFLSSFKKDAFYNFYPFQNGYLVTLFRTDIENQARLIQFLYVYTGFTLQLQGE
mgnify:CR=1 FL=1